MRRIKNDEKRLIADYYYTLIANPKSYNNITGDAMYKEFYKLFANDYSIINKLLSVDEFNKLKEIAKIIKKDGFYVSTFYNITFKESLFFKDIVKKADSYDKYYYL